MWIIDGDIAQGALFLAQILHQDLEPDGMPTVERARIDAHIQSNTLLGYKITEYLIDYIRCAYSATTRYGTCGQLSSTFGMLALGLR